MHSSILVPMASNVPRALQLKSPLWLALTRTCFILADFNVNKVMDLRSELETKYL